MEVSSHQHLTQQMSGKISANFFKSSWTLVIFDRKLLPPGCVWETTVVLLKPVRAFIPVLLSNIYGITVNLALTLSKNWRKSGLLCSCALKLLHFGLPCFIELNNKFQSRQITLIRFFAASLTSGSNLRKTVKLRCMLLLSIGPSQQLHLYSKVNKQWI